MPASVRRVDACDWLLFTVTKRRMKSTPYLSDTMLALDVLAAHSRTLARTGRDREFASAP